MLHVSYAQKLCWHNSPRPTEEQRQVRREQVRKFGKTIQDAERRDARLEQ